MPPAARLSDPTAHGTPLTGAASPSVLVGGLPAWRALGDVHTCPLAVPATPPIPHVGGVVQPGSSSVLIEGLPAARLGDTVLEATIPNTVVGGCPTVLIGP
jgi:uncharacterized Zn-binding protein involved in type VI secretion